MAIFHNLLLRIFDLKIAWRFFTFAALKLRLENGAFGYENQTGRVAVMKYGIWGRICPSAWDDKDADVVCRQLHYTGKGKGRYMVSISKTGKGEERKMHNSGINPMLWKLWSFMSRLFCGKLQRYNILYISFVHLVCWFFRRGGVPGDVLWQRSLLPGGGEL